MKKWIVLLMASLLVGCSQNVSPIEEANHVQATLKAMPEIIEEKSSYYIHDELMPSYAMLSDYPTEALIDWDARTGIETSEWLEFKMVKSENIRSIELFTENVDEVEIEIKGNIERYAIIDQHEILEFEESVNSNQVKIRTLQGNIMDVHITYDLLVDKETYAIYQELDQDLMILEDFDWQKEPLEAFETLNQVYENYTIDELELLSKNIDMNRLMILDRGVGCPYSLMGKVVSVKLREQYYEIIIDTIIDHEEVTVYTKKKYELNSMFQEHCILIDKESTMKFITIQ